MITTEVGYSDIYSDLYGGSPTDAYVSVQVAFESDPVDAPVWTELFTIPAVDLGSVLRTFSTRRGRGHELDTFEAGTMSLTLDNRDRRFDPLYASSPYYPNVIPMRRIRLVVTFNGTEFILFTGYVDSWPQEYRYPTDGIVEVSATDAFKVLANIPLPSVWEQEVRADNPRSWYRFDEQGGTIIVDAMGQHDGTYAQFETLQEKSLLPYDQGSAVLVPLVADLSPTLPASATPTTASWSVELWVNVSENEPLTLLSNAWHNQGLTAAQLTLTSGNLAFQIVDSTGIVATAESSSDVVPDDSVHHIVLVSPSGSALQIYVDGVDVTDFSAGTGRAVTSLPWVLNPSTGSGISTVTYDDLIFYDSALSADRIAAHYEGAFTAWAGDTSGERIERVLAYAEWPLGDQDIDLGDSTLQRADLDNGTALDHMQDVELTESGRLFVSGAGVVTFIERHAVLEQTAYATSQATFGDAGAELKYADITFDYSDAQIRNDIRVTSPALPPQVASDATSQATYLHHGYERQVLEESIAAMQDAAQYILSRYKDPFLRVASITIKPRRDEATLFPQVLGRELGDRVTVKRRPQGIGTVISQECHIEAIAHEVDAEHQTWVTTWTLSPADTRNFFIWDVSNWDDDALWAS